MAASRKPGLLRILPGNRYFSQPKCCKHCGMRNYESEPSLPPIPIAAPPLSPKNSGSNIRSGLFSLCLGLQGRFPNLSTHLSRKKKEKKWGDIAMEWGNHGGGSHRSPSTAHVPRCRIHSAVKPLQGWALLPSTASPAPSLSWGSVSLHRAKSSTGGQGK